MAAVIPYVFCSLAGSLIALRRPEGRRASPLNVIEGVAFAFSVFTVYGCGPVPVLYGLLMLLLGMPVYVWQRRAHTTRLPRHGLAA